MTQSASSTASDRASNPTLAPVRKEIEVPCPAPDAFRLFTEELGRWWPLATHSLSGESARGCGIDGHAGGELYEIDPAGARQVWGTVLVWEPTSRVVFTFHPGRDAASAGRVEVRFAPSGSGSRVTLEHSGWELLGERAAEVRRSYDAGWGDVFGRRFYQHCVRAAS
jgi:uncharacterized protein YndB with AHSA1/START domain